MVELYLNAKLHNRISEDAYRSVLTLKNLDDQDLKLRSDLLRQVDNGSIRLTGTVVSRIMSPLIINTTNASIITA